jgi:hypothetical protein
MLHHDAALEIVDVGVDWITATAARDDQGEALQNLGRLLLHEQAALGNIESLWKGQGYHGKRCGAVAVGVRHDGCILRLSSSAAASHYRQTILTARQVSRIDLQVTASDSSQLADRAHLAYYQTSDAPRRGGRPPSASLRLDQERGQTCYIGSRTSDVVGRLYDKGLEQKNAPQGQYWRYELEYKRQLAKSVAHLVSRAETGPDHIAARVVDYFAARGVPGPEVRNNLSSILREAGRPTTLDRKSDHDRSLRWLSNSVAPTVQRLLESDQREALLRALGLADQ